MRRPGLDHARNRSLLIAVSLGLALFALSKAPAQRATPDSLAVAVIGVAVTIWPAIVADKKYRSPLYRGGNKTNYSV
jgi:hypothetical protein